ncbi:hypothetical protein [Nocardia bovistercoris]|uniref:Uncharacterized protein n=1 Tax=Nocardia bovistercoris TaxID=2785916 RepID=A0A931IBL3_9NOCA|nr:hypothetical protein [Nocardia bovistercoris]MBH0778374.1 hypothetical protein [Nocardia bovistercoris]
MIDRSTFRTTDEVSEADLAEQAAPAYPDDPAEVDLADAVARDIWSADPADVVEQSIPAPLDDEDFAPGA